MSQGRLRDLWAAKNRALAVGLLLTITFVASESLAVVTVMPLVARDLGGLRLYGWAFSAFTLSSVVGIVAAGRAADRRGPAVPFIAGLVLFGAGLAIAGLARSMPMLVAGRALQGLGAGVVPAVAYAAIGVSLPEELRPRMIAVISTAWVVPGLAGPALSAAVARAFGWRWVFLGLLPVVAIAGSIALPALIRIGRPDPARTSDGPEHRLADAVRTAIGAGLVLAGLTVGFGRRTIVLAIALVAVGLPLAGPALRRLVPAGTLTARQGIPAAVLSRGLLTFTFFGADSFVTLSITMVRHYSPLVAGLAVTGATVTWTIGAWTQARLSDTWEARRLIRLGLVVILIGIAGMTLMLQPNVPIAAGILAWTIAGLGMGLANSPIMLLVLRDAPEGRVGQASASVNLTDVLVTATGIGVGGAAIAAYAATNLQLGIRIAFAIAAIMAVLTLLTSLRLPAGRTTAAKPALDSEGV
jgi:MFS family permease